MFPLRLRPQVRTYRNNPGGAWRSWSSVRWCPFLCLCKCVIYTVCCKKVTQGSKIKSTDFTSFPGVDTYRNNKVNQSGVILFLLGSSCAVGFLCFITHTHTHTLTLFLQSPYSVTVKRDLCPCLSAHCSACRCWSLFLDGPPVRHRYTLTASSQPDCRS